MGSQDVHATVRGLIRLQQIDHDVLRVRRRLEEGPRLVESRGEKYRLGETKVAAAHEQVKHAKTGVARLELELKSKEQDIQKAAAQQLEARTNQEYRALADHQVRLRKECDALEDQVLAAMNAVEAAETEERGLRKDLEEQRGEKQSFEEQWRRDQAEYERDLAATGARREELARALPKGALLVYERVLKARAGEAVVAVEGRVCGGCRMALTPNDLARLHSGGELVTCKSCERILFIPEVHDSAV